MTQSDKKRISLPVFFLLLFGVCWIGATPMVLSSFYPQRVPVVLRIVQLLMFFGPAIVAIFAAGMNGGKQGVKDLLRGLLKWRVGIWWYAIALFAPLLLSLGARFAAQLFGVNLPPLAQPSTVLTSFASTFLVYFLLNTEEIAWRGYALPPLQNQFGPVKASIILGLLWGVFHIPIFMMKGGHPAGYSLIPYLLMVFAMTFVFTWFFNSTSGSILIVHLLHQSFNSWAEAVPFYPRVAHSSIPFAVIVVLFCISALIVTAVGLGQSRERIARQEA